MFEFNHPGINAILLDSLSKGSDFQTILDRLSTEVKADISMIDFDSGQIISSSCNTVSMPLKSHHIQAAARAFSEKSSRIVEMDPGLSYMVCPILFGNTSHSAAIILLTESCSSETAESLGRAISKLYGYFFGEHSNGLFNVKNHIIARYMLLNRDAKDLSLFRDTNPMDPELLRTSFRPGYATVVFRSHDAFEKSFPVDILALLTRYCPNSICLRDGQRILALLHGIETERIRDNTELCTALRSFCEFTNTECTVSGVFQCLDDRFSYIRQAAALLKRFPPLSPDRLSLAEEHFTESILAGALENISPEYFLRSDIDRLMQYDRENQTIYYETLVCYLESGNRLTQAAKRLYIDRGTLKYRLEKIKKILHCDPDDPVTAKSLLLALKIYTQTDRTE